MAVASNDRRGALVGSLRERNGAEGLSGSRRPQFEGRGGGRPAAGDLARRSPPRRASQRSCPRRAARREPPATPGGHPNPRGRRLGCVPSPSWRLRQAAFGDDVLEIYSVRCTLEAMAADLVIDKSAAGVTNMFEEKLRELEQESLSHADLPDVITTDLQFHRAFVAAAGNSPALTYVGAARRRAPPGAGPGTPEILRCRLCAPQTSTARRGDSSWRPCPGTEDDRRAYGHRPEPL